MNWINSFELLCYSMVLLLFFDLLKNKNYREFGLLISGALAGFALELLAVRLTDIYHYSNKFYISIGFAPYQFPFFGGLMWGGITVCALRIAKKLIVIFFKLLSTLISQRKNLICSHKKDWPVVIFWLSMYGYCIGGLFTLGIPKALPVYGIFAFLLFLLTLALSLVDVKESSRT